jgi:hypothetical protein
MKTKTIDLTDDLWLETLAKLRHDIYHLPEYVYLESLRNKASAEAILIFEDDKIFFLPYLWRRCDDLFDENLATAEFFDVVSPYGYPGIVLSEAAANDREFVKLAMNQLISAFRAKGFCSAFFRLNPIINGGLEEILSPDICKISGETVSVNLTLSEAEIWQQTRADHRNKINKCGREGISARMVSPNEYLNDFNAIYEETMDRVGASKLYYFGKKYFEEIVDVLGEKLHLCLIELNGEIICSGLFTECCGIVQFHLSGTKSSFLKQAPTTLMLDYVRFWAKERGNQVLHLGGGVGGGKDSLYQFKAGFSKERHTFLTLRLISDEEKYNYLTNLRAKFLNVQPEKLLESGFFPAYRSLH